MAQNTQDQIDKLTKAITEFADKSRQTDDAWTGIARSITSGAKSFDSGLLKSITSFTGMGPAISGISKSFASALTGNKEMVNQMARQRVALLKMAQLQADPDKTDAMRDQAAKITQYLRAHHTLSKDVTGVLQGK